VTVRAWFTISAVAMAALVAAVVLKAFAPLQPPAILATAGPVRLTGSSQGSCWPQRGSKLRCEPADPKPKVPPAVLPASGTIRVVTAFPVQPKDGSVRIEDSSGNAVLSDPSWTDDVRYTLEPGSYVLRAQADYPARAYVRWAFAFVVR
jgi:hypothetical protein